MPNAASERGLPVIKPALKAAPSMKITPLPRNREYVVQRMMPHAFILCELSRVAIEEPMLQASQKPRKTFSSISNSKYSLARIRAQDTIDTTPGDSVTRVYAASDYPPNPLREPRPSHHLDCRGRRWLNEIITNSGVTIEAIAAREDCSPLKVNMTISLAFLAPSLVQAAINGLLPHGMGVTRLCDLPPEWSRQHQVLRLPPA